MLSDVCQQSVIYIRTPETWALSVAGASLESLRGTYQGDQQFGEYCWVLLPCARVFSGYIPGYPIFRSPAETAWLQSAPAATAGVATAEAAKAEREFRRQLGIFYSL